MTLHWWMHWFWITAVAVSVCVCSPTLSSVESTEYKPTPSPPIAGDANSSSAEENAGDVTLSSTISPPRGHRGGKAIGQPPPNPATVLPYFKVSIAFPLPTGSDTEDEGPAMQKELSLNLDYKKPQPTEEIKTISTTAAPKIEEKNITESNVNETEGETSTPQDGALNNTSEEAVVPNSVVDSNTTVVTNNSSLNESASRVLEEVKEESNSNNTTVVELSTARALLLETGVGRRAADSDVSKSQVALGDGGLDAGAVSGICFGILVVLGLGGAISLVLYRRRYLNKPQTLNDKCSNPDSSGYIDDSTIRENSEEMYSLDNDSFLNSLEAMTIQNYWTDSVKHTKL